MKKTGTLITLEKIALVMIIIGAIGSICLTLYTGRHNSSVILMALFIIWVCSPFAGLVVANKTSKHWPVVNRQVFYWLMIALTTGSLIGYSGLFNPPGMKTAGIFLIIPLLSWICIVIAVLIGRSASRRFQDSTAQ